ncbi:MAG: sigma-54 dependent transcriptional regulator [Acidobacteriia bacterium]|nr:sigma-54 dependent transcriptional regulator [Terriglobia bacterium]
MSGKGSVLIVDDEAVVRDSLSKWLREEGYEVGTAENATEALKQMVAQRWDLALVDIRMPGTDGIELQKRLRQIDPDLIVIIITGYASVETAVQALKQGAYDYVTKPFDPDDIAHLIRNAIGHRRAARESLRLQETLAEVIPPVELVGNSAPMRAVLQAIETVAPTDATVLITGESGTGKELVARAIHRLSPRRFHPFVVIHCGALPETLLESELFGHEKGAFTGAQYRRKGKFEIADGGTVFLDEIGDISLKTQTDLLRVLQDHQITRIGSTQPIQVDFRCIAATHRNLEQLIAEGSFRPDLYYRLNVFRIELPPLRQRPDDIPLLVEHFVRKFSQQMNKPIVRVAPEAMALLQAHPWPGNVRELENAVERAMVVAQGPELRVQDFTLKLQGSEREPQTLEEVERAHILKVLEECGGNQTRAAQILDIDRVTLHNKLKRYGWKKKPVAGQ